MRPCCSRLRDNAIDIRPWVAVLAMALGLLVLATGCYQTSKGSAEQNPATSRERFDFVSLKVNPKHVMPPKEVAAHSGQKLDSHVRGHRRQR